MGRWRGPSEPIQTDGKNLGRVLSLVRICHGGCFRVPAQLGEQAGQKKRNANRRGQSLVVRSSPLAPNRSPQEGRSKQKAGHQNDAPRHTVVRHSADPRCAAIGGQTRRDQTITEVLIGADRGDPCQQLTIHGPRRSEIDPAPPWQLKAQPIHGLSLIRRSDIDAGQLNGVRPVVVTDLQKLGTADLQDFSSTRRPCRQQQHEQTHQTANHREAPQLGQKRCSCAVTAPQEPQLRVVSLASSGWDGKPTIWALLLPGGTIG